MASYERSEQTRICLKSTQIIHLTRSHEGKHKVCLQSFEPRKYYILHRFIYDQIFFTMTYSFVFKLSTYSIRPRKRYEDFDS